MKVHSRHSFNREHRQKKVLRLFALAAGIVVLGMFLPRIYSNVSRVVLYPVQVIDEWFRTSTARLPLYLRGQHELVQKIHDLEGELAVAASTDLTQQRLYEENLWLRELLGADARERIGAAVVARPNELPYDFLQIDKGEVDGVRIGAPVYIGADNVIGVVSQVAPHYAFVELFTTAGFTATTFISGANVIATMEGMGGGVARVRAPQGIPLQVGNLVHVPSITPGVFGRIEYLENRPSQPEQFGYITFKKSIASINYVAVGVETISPATPEKIETNIADIIRQTVNVDMQSLKLGSSTIKIATTTATTSRQ